MRNIVIISLLSLFGFVNLVKAQDDEIRQQCLINISLFNESAKNKQYADAFGPWKSAYTDCPGENRAIYTRGREIMHWYIGQAKTDAEYQEAFDMLMGMYDNRIKYFGDDNRYPTPWILGLKGLDYISFAKNDELKKDAYNWLGQSIEGMGDKSELEVLRQYTLLSSLIYKAEPNHAEQFVNDYLKTAAILDKQAADPANKNAEIASQIKQALDYVFVQSGAAECSTLDQIYSAQVDENLQNIEYLTKVLSFYRVVGCTESEVYFKAAVAAHEIQPTNESANALAQMSYKKNDFSEAISYYDEATDLAENNSDKADYQYRAAQVAYNNLKNYPRARQYALKSLTFNPNSGKAYILIGLMYANSRGVYDDPLLQKSVYWVAVDKFNRAKQVDSDPEIVKNANDLIRTYSQHFPSKEDIFFKAEWNLGEQFRVGGWIGETTTVRAAN